MGQFQFRARAGLDSGVLRADAPDSEIRERNHQAVLDAFENEWENWHVMIAAERHTPGWKVELLGRPGAFIARVLATVIAKRRVRR